MLPIIYLHMSINCFNIYVNKHTHIEKVWVKTYLNRCMFQLVSLSWLTIQGIILIIQENNGTADIKNANNCLNTNIYSYLETSGGQSSNLYLNVIHFFNNSVN
jgi:hypothetical protein